MKQLKLDVGSLAVQSFTTAEVEGSRGTVRAHWTAYPSPPSCECHTGASICLPCTDWETCANTCETCDQLTCLSCDTCQITGACDC